MLIYGTFSLLVHDYKISSATCRDLNHLSNPQDTTLAYYTNDIVQITPGEKEEANWPDTCIPESKTSPRKI